MIKINLLSKNPPINRDHAYVVLFPKISKRPYVWLEIHGNASHCYYEAKKVYDLVNKDN
jgi:hypothetical protein